MRESTKKKLKTIYRTYLQYADSPLIELHNRTAKIKSNKSTIPSIVYQTWVDNLFGKTHFAEIEKFRDLNPDMSFQLFNQSTLENYMYDVWGQHPIYIIFQNSQFGPMKADIFRYCILCERGGYYFDISKGCRVPISSFCDETSQGLISFENHDCFVPPEKNSIHKILYPTKYVLQWGMGFVKDHPILMHMISDICEYYPYYKNKIFGTPKHAILAFTGPGMFTMVVRKAFNQYSDLNVTQAGIDFNGAGIVEMKGCQLRYVKMPAYADFRNRVIVE